MNASEQEPEVNVDETLVERAREIGLKAQKRTAKSAEPTVANTPAAAAQLSLDLYPDDNRATPNVLLRSAAFPVLAKRPRTKHGEPLSPKEIDELAQAPRRVGKSREVAPRRYVNNVEIPCLDSARYRIVFSGEVFDQADRDVYELLIDLGKTQPLGTLCVFSANNFLKLIDRPAGSGGYDWLESAFMRLLKGTFAITQIDAAGTETKLFGGHLVDSLTQDKATKKWSLRLGTEMHALYTQGAKYTYYPLEHRLPLKGHPLASWLQGFFCTHVAPVPISLDALKLYSGSESKSLRGFKQKVDIACERLKTLKIFESYGWMGQGSNAKLFVVPCLNKSQQAWLRKKQAAAVPK